MQEQKSEQHTSADSTTIPYRIWMPILTILAGLSLSALYVLGTFTSINSPAFAFTFLAHLALLLLAVILCLLQHLHICQAAPWNSSLLFAFSFVCILGIAIFGLVPITARDALIHHIAVPKWWIESGTISRIPWHEWSHYPMLINIGFTGLMQLGLTKFVSLYHALYLIILCGVTSSFCAYKTKDQTIAYLAFLIPLTIPMCIRLGASPLVDLGLACYAAIFLAFLVYWAEEKRSIFILFFAALAAGLALSCKYNAFLFVGLASMLFLVFSLREKISDFKILFALLSIAFLSSCVVLPWLLNNALATGNPFYPMFQSLFANTHSGAPLGPRGLKPLEKLYLLYGESWIDILLLPLRMILFGEDDNPRLFDGRLSPILFLSIIPIFFLRKKPWVVFFYLLCFAYFYLAITFSSARIRYMAPIFFPLFALTFCGLCELRQRLPKFMQYIFIGLVTSVHLGFSAYYIFEFMHRKHIVAYMSKKPGFASEEEYLSNMIAEYPLIRYINTELHDQEKTYLLLTGNKFYYYDKPVISGGYYSQNTILRWIRLAGSADYLFQDFKQRNIGQLLVHTERSKEALFNILSLEERQVWNEFQTKYLRFLASHGSYSLWKIQEKAENVQGAVLPNNQSFEEDESLSP